MGSRLQAHKATWLLDYKVVWDHGTNKTWYKLTRAKSINQQTRQAGEKVLDLKVHDFLSSVLVRSCEKCKPIYLHFLKGSSHLTWKVDVKNWQNWCINFIEQYQS